MMYAKNDGEASSSGCWIMDVCVDEREESLLGWFLWEKETKFVVYDGSCSHLPSTSEMRWTEKAVLSRKLLRLSYWDIYTD